MIFFGSLSNVNPLECFSIKNQECKVRPEIINVNSNDPIFYPFSIKTNKCSGNLIILVIHINDQLILMINLCS